MAIRVAKVGDVSRADLDLLDPVERARAERRTNPEASRAAHVVLRQLLEEEVGVAAGEVRITWACGRCGSDRHGKPVLPDHPEVHVSLSHREEFALAGLSRAGAIGVDIEQSSATGFAGFDAVALATQERLALADLIGLDQLHARARMWARKEAILKAMGHGLLIDPACVVVSGPTETARLVDWLAPPPAPPELTLGDLQLPDRRHAAAFAVLAPGPVEIDYT